MKKLLCAIIAVLCLTGSVWATEGVIPAKSLISEVKQNQMRFDKNYKGKVITVSGFMGKIEDEDGKYTAELKPYNDRPSLFDFVQCVFDKSQEDSLLELNQGDEVTIRGLYNGKQQFQLGALVLSNCEVLEEFTFPAKDKEEASNIISCLRNMKAATMMFFADNMDDIRAGKMESAILADGSAQTLLEEYLDKPIPPNYFFTLKELGEWTKWCVGCVLAENTYGIRNVLRENAETIGLFNENMMPYDGGDLVLMIAR